MQKTRQGGDMPTQAWAQNLRTTPEQHARTLRTQYVRTLSSMKPGKMHPIAFVPMLREDGLNTTRMRVAFDMLETADLLLNNVRVAVHAHFVPKLAQERFRSIDELHRSFNKEAGAPPWYNEMLGLATKPDDGSIFLAAGIHTHTGDINDDYVRSYNIVWNHRAKQRSPSIPLRNEDDIFLAPAFWPATVFKHIKPSFDQAMIEGEVPLNIIGQQMFVKAQSNQPGSLVRVQTPNGDFTRLDSSTATLGIGSTSGAASTEALFTELADNGVTVSLSNLDLARKTAAWARLRAQYQGLSEDWMMDQLLSGVGIPEQYLNQPILLDRKETIFGMNQRYATDGTNLDKSVADGRTFVDLTMRMPPMNTGGVIVITAEIVPEQIYERVEDPYLTNTDQALLPDRTRDELDPEPVSVVKNGYVDQDHTTPEDIFGYAPLNHQWQMNAPRLGGKFYRNAGDTWNQDRNRIWTPEVVDPVLGANFYLADGLKWDVFSDQSSDPFEVNSTGMCFINGLTYFGPALREAEGHYDAVLSKVDLDRIDLPAATAADEPQE